MIDFLDLENVHDELLDGIHLLLLGFISFIPSWGSSLSLTRGFGGCYEVILFGVKSDTWSYEIGSYCVH